MCGTLIRELLEQGLREREKNLFMYTHAGESKPPALREIWLYFCQNHLRRTLRFGRCFLSWAKWRKRNTSFEISSSVIFLRYIPPSYSLERTKGGGNIISKEIPVSILHHCTVCSSSSRSEKSLQAKSPLFGHKKRHTARGIPTEGWSGTFLFAEWEGEKEESPFQQPIL